MKFEHVRATPIEPAKYIVGALLRARAGLLALMLVSSLAHAEPLGRLFFTPERRALLERQRQLDIQEKTAETVELVANVHVNGMVRRSGGKSTVWINGRPQLTNEASGGVTVRPSRRDQEQVEISVGEETPASLRIGETLNRATQEKTSGLAGGQLQINRNDENSRRPR